MPNKTDSGTEKNGMSGKLTGMILRAKEGDEDAFSALLLQYTPLIEAAVAPHRSQMSEQDIEELRQEALLAFHRAVMSYELLYGDVSFGLYAKICVSKGIASALRQFRSRANISVVSIDDVPPVELGGIYDPASEIIARESAAELRRTIRENLSKYENTVWWMYYSGMSAEEIAESLGTTKKSVGNALTRIKRKLRTLLS